MHFHNKCLGLRRNPCPFLSRERKKAPVHLCQHYFIVAAAKGRIPTQHYVKYHPTAPHVTLVVITAVYHLWGDVICLHNEYCSGQRGQSGVWLQFTRGAEVYHLSRESSALEEIKYSQASGPSGLCPFRGTPEPPTSVGRGIMRPCSRKSP